MAGFSKEEREQIIREYFGPAGDEESPCCPHCGEELSFESGYDPQVEGFRIQVRCPDCGEGFAWKQDRQAAPWEELHLRYFVERYKEKRPIRCPLDDCYVNYIEFENGVLEFRCPYCNHRGQASESHE